MGGVRRWGPRLAGAAHGVAGTAAPCLLDPRCDAQPGAEVRPAALIVRVWRWLRWASSFAGIASGVTAL